MKKLLVILGPTATGKTDIGISLAKKLNGEIVACDSRQVYQGLDIGTGKEISMKSEVRSEKFNRYWEIDGIKIHMYDVASPKKQYTVFDYKKDAEKIIEEILRKGKLPIIVGGTGLYLKALLEGLPNLKTPIDKKLRKELEKLSLGELQEKLKKLSPTKFSQMNSSDQKNSRRLLRSIELILMNPYMNEVISHQTSVIRQDILKIGLSAPREFLNKKIDIRVFSRIDQGMIVEAENLIKNSVTINRMRELGLEYGVLADFLENKLSKEEFIKTLQIKIHQYAKRQMTWFKNVKDVNWFDISKKGWEKKVEMRVVNWYNSEVRSEK